MSETVSSETAVELGRKYIIPAKGGRTLAVRVTTQPRYVQYGEIKWVGFMGRRIRRDNPDVSFGSDVSYLVRRDQIKPLDIS